MIDFILLEFHWTQLLQPQWYIENGGLWFIVFVIFAETGLFAGFFLPGDSLLFVTGIYSDELIKSGLGFNGSRYHWQLCRLLVWQKEWTIFV
jgi:membrane-associated protein